jgi:periplasmic copper chaperone A
MEAPMTARPAPALAPIAAILAASLAVVAQPAAAAGGVHAIAVQDAWSRPATAGLPGVGYLTLVNHGSAPDRLVSASSPKAAAVTLHRSSMAKGVMTMTALPDGLELPPGKPVQLAPNGYHLMLARVKGGLKLGERYPLTLRFAHSRPETVQVEVRAGAAETMTMR